MAKLPAAIVAAAGDIGGPRNAGAAVVEEKGMAKKGKKGAVASSEPRDGVWDAGKCGECAGTGRKWFRLPDDVGSPHAVPCPRGCPMEELPPVVIEVAPSGEGLSNRPPPPAAKARGYEYIAIGVPQRELQGHVTIGVPQRSDGSEFVEIRVEDGLSGATFAEVRVGLAEFARALAARRVECAFRLSGIDVVGKLQEHKTVDIRHPCPEDHACERDDLLREAVAPHEADGWAGDIGDFRNMHKRLSSPARWTVHRIGFSRYVDPEGSATAEAPPLKRAGKRKAGKKIYKRRKCHTCGKRATQYADSPYLSELHPGEPNPRMFWCDRCLEESAREI